jgi:AraC-like DNA-binding protein
LTICRDAPDDVFCEEGPRSNVVDGRRHVTSRDGIRRFVAGATDPTLVMTCGFFSVSFGQSTELFTTLSAPIVEHFGAGDQLDVRLRQALNELIAQEAGSGAMSGALLKQVIVMLMRRSLATPGAWVERLAMLNDIQIARAFSEMVADPGLDHSVHSLARVACLSRSAFMARFTAVMGRSPMMYCETCVCVGQRRSSRPSRCLSDKSHTKLVIQAEAVLSVRSERRMVSTHRSTGLSCEQARPFTAVR